MERHFFCQVISEFIEIVNPPVKKCGLKKAARQEARRQGERQSMYIF